MNFVYNDSVDLRQYNFGEELNNTDFKESLSTLSVVSYRYIDFDKTNYHFFQDCFDNRDIVEYFSFMNLLTSHPFNELISNKDKDWHLNANDYFKDKNFRKLVNIALDNKKKLKVEQVPMFYHFALYTEQKANRKTKVKSPRIYFFIGKEATIYPLFYDPYHEINP